MPTGGGARWGMTLVLDLLENAGLLLAVCFTYRFIAARWPDDRLRREGGAGVLFGAAAAIAMSMAVAVPGVGIFDARTVVLSLGALYGGPVTAALAGGLAGGYRIYLGGETAAVVVGLLVIASACLIGLGLRQRWRDRLHEIEGWRFLAFGAAVQAAAVLLFGFLPGDYVSTVLLQLAPGFVAILTLASLPMGLMLREVERLRSIDRELAEREERYHDLFEANTVAALEEDVSAVFRALQDLRADGVTDLRTYLRQEPAAVDRLADAVHILHANEAAVRLFGVSSLQALRGPIRRFFTDDSRAAFVDELCAWWEGAERFQQETSFKTADGEIRRCILSTPLPEDARGARHTPVSLLDVTHQRSAERQALEEQRRLNEVIWGAGVGTWEWNVQTGEATFNERWAEIVGYRLEELAPVTIETWRSLARPEDLARSEAALSRVFAGEDAVYECEVRMRHKNGDWVWVLDRGKVIERDGAGRPVRMSGTHLDVTDRKRAEEAALRLAGVRVTLLRCHAAILRAEDEDALFRATARILARDRGYAGVRIDAVADAAGAENVGAGATNRLRPILSVHSDGATAAGAAAAPRDGVSVKAARSGVMESGIEAAPAGVGSGSVRAVVALPLYVEQGVAAVLTIYAPTGRSFDDEELQLFSEFSDNMGLALTALRLRAEKRALHSELEEAALGAVRAIAATIEKRDPYTSGHQLNVARISEAIAERLGWDRFKIEGLRLGAMIHDIGKIYVPAEILTRPGRLAESEFELIKTHPRIGSEILAETRFPWPIQDMVGQHHERIDGSGYPDGLTGEQICDEAKVIAVADVLDAVTSHRPYRPGLGVAVAIEELQAGRGTRYDAQAVDACLAELEARGGAWWSADPPREAA